MSDDDLGVLDDDTVTMLLYGRHGDLIRFRVRNMTNHELREIMIGCWARLDQDDRMDFIKELMHYGEMFLAPDQFPERHLSQLAEAIYQRGGP